MIAKEKEAEILRLYHGEKRPVGTIAGQLGLHHTTVQRVLGQAGVDPKVVAPRPSMVDPFVPFLVEQLGKYPSLRSSRLFVMLKERGYPGGPDHLRQVIGRLRPKKPAEASQRLRTLPGEQAQVDWAHFGKLAIGRATRPRRQPDRRDPRPLVGPRPADRAARAPPAPGRREAPRPRAPRP
ncbi:hypothetical protein WMF37_47280 [Sorangium sp. So ce291]|uniref:hypothetical protein n=1 Tax=Sorangium sp. So ce291 TaxID=3133294 RepID=UPI003F5E1089